MNRSKSNHQNQTILLLEINTTLHYIRATFSEKAKGQRCYVTAKPRICPEKFNNTRRNEGTGI